MKQDLKVGDKVRVNDPGLLMLRRFAPPGAKPHNDGVITEIDEEEQYVKIEFPIGDDALIEHSQVAWYELRFLVKIG